DAHLVPDRQLGPARHDEVRLDRAQVVQGVEQRETELGCARSGDADDEPLAVGHAEPHFWSNPQWTRGVLAATLPGRAKPSAGVTRGSRCGSTPAAARMSSPGRPNPPR